MSQFAQRKAGPQLVRSEEPVIGFSQYDRIAPGQYPAFSRAASISYDKGFQRWVCSVWWNVFRDASSVDVIARLPWWLNLGSGQKPYAGRRSNFYQAWMRANGGCPPSRHDRPSPQVFVRRMALIVVRDSRGVDPYSVVEMVKEWLTGESLPGPSIQPSTHPSNPSGKWNGDRNL